MNIVIYFMIIQMGTHLDLEDGLVRMLSYQRPIFLTLGLIYRLSES